MKRSKQTEGMLQYRNTGGVLKINGQFVKRNEVFFAFPEEIPESFMDTIVCLSEKTKISLIPEPEVEISYTLADRGTGYFDIIDQDGKKVNEKGLRREAAEEALKALQEG